ncbi:MULTISPECIES: hypothetical protein [Parabacteroides]|uniref:hypothetical protein n=1 Tax=Parabacteroides leei TaxID=2939491 RepID=UPI00189A1DD7|nr:MULTISPECIES: hypothetical protein [Parabacteroides]MCL3851220.1 hypothetical protein [Parabacteroides leei]
MNKLLLLFGVFWGIGVASIHGLNINLADPTIFYENGTMRYVFHIHHSNPGVAPRQTFFFPQLINQ